MASHARAPRAATLEITSERVYLQRADTSNPLPLSRDSLSPIGEGDTLIAEPRGRALIHIDGGGVLLVMPETILEFITFAEDRVRLSIHGHVIVVQSENSTVEIQVDTDLLQVFPTGSTGVWSGFEGGDVITSVDTRVRYIDPNGNDGIVLPGNGVYVNESDVHLVDLENEAPYLHAAQLIGIWRGCPAIIYKTAGEALNLRVGPGLTSSVIGYGDEGAPVKIMGVSASGNWFRVQRFSGFGWMRGSYLDGTCTDLPTYPNNQVEQNLELRDVQPAEFTILEPYFGTPETNGWVYRSFRASPFDDAQ